MEGGVMAYLMGFDHLEAYAESNGTDPYADISGDDSSDIIAFLRFPPLLAPTGRNLLKHLVTDILGDAVLKGSEPPGENPPDEDPPDEDPPGEDPPEEDPPVMSYVLGSVDQFPGVFSGAGWDGYSFEYVHGAVGSDGNIYLAPYWGGAKPVRINVSDNTVSFLDDNPDGEFFAHSYVHAVNGKVYSVNTDTTGDTMCINESTGVVSLINGPLGNIGNNPWTKGDLSDNGKIYCARGDSGVLVVDTNTDSTYTIDIDNDLQDMWGWTVHAGNGILYSAPYKSSGILRIDSLTDTVTQIGDFGTGSLKTYRGLLGYDGKVYFFPDVTYTNIICLDPSDDSTSLISGSVDLSDFDSKWKSAVAHPNGNIYMVPHDSNAVLVVDTTAGTVREICNTEILEADVSRYSKWWGGAVGPDGKIYCAPLYAKKIMCIDPVTETASFIPIDFSPNYYGGDCYGALVSGDKMYMLPSMTSDLVVLSFIRQEDPPEEPWIPPFFEDEEMEGEPPGFCRVEVYVNNRQFICDDGMGKVRFQTRQILQYPELNVGVISRYGRTKMKQVSVDSVEI